MNFTEAQQRAIASRLGHLLDSISDLRGAGVESETLQLLEDEALGLAESARADPERRTVALHALVADILVTTAELEPRRLRGYGELDPEAAELLEHVSGRLRELARVLSGELTGRLDRPTSHAPTGDHA
jgi:hypothetical protein